MRPASCRYTHPAVRRQGLEPRTHCLRGSRSTVELAAHGPCVAEVGRLELPTEDVSCYGLAIRCLTTRPNLQRSCRPPSACRRQELAPRTGIEPATSRSTGACSPTELTGLGLTGHYLAAYPERDSNAQPHRSERCASAVGPPGHELHTCAASGGLEPPTFRFRAGRAASCTSSQRVLVLLPGRQVPPRDPPAGRSAQEHRRPVRNRRRGPQGHACLGRSPVTLALVAAAAGGHGVEPAVGATARTR